MPQMGPLLWLNLYFYALIILFILIVLIYFTMATFNNQQNFIDKMSGKKHFVFKW